MRTEVYKVLRFLLDNRYHHHDQDITYLNFIAPFTSTKHKPRCSHLRIFEKWIPYKNCRLLELKPLMALNYRTVCLAQMFQISDFVFLLCPD
jgi:hypothetical protein